MWLTRGYGWHVGATTNHLHSRTFPRLLTQLHLIKLHRRWHKTLAQLYTGWMQDASVHGKEELSSDLSFASKTIYFSHFDPQNRGRVKCEARTLSDKPISKHHKTSLTSWSLLAMAWRSQPFEGIGPSLPPGLKTLAASVSSVLKHDKNIQKPNRRFCVKNMFLFRFQGRISYCLKHSGIPSVFLSTAAARGIRTTFGLRSKASSRPAKCGVPASRA